MQTEHAVTTAASLLAGSCARIVAVDPSSGASQRLGELGFQPDEAVLIHRSGDPVILEIRGALLAIDRQTAECIQLRTEDV